MAMGANRPGIPLNDGRTIPPIGFGTWKIRPNFNAKSTVLHAIKCGYRLIDTATIYGNEKGVGAAIHESGLQRKELFVTTKLWNEDQGYDSALKAFDRSLHQLGLEYVDLYLIHWPVPEKRLASWRALEEIYVSGKAKSIGVSNYTINHLEELKSVSNIIPAVNQIEFHPFLYKEQEELLRYCTEKGIAVEAYSPLAHGERLNDPVISEIAKVHIKTNAQIMLRWASQHGTIPIPKSMNKNRIAENIKIFDFSLSELEMRRINNLSDGMRTCWDPNLMR